jgi:secreted Zn-dependent insulinase-like peptidase
MPTDYTERIASIEEQITQLKNRQRELMQKSKLHERKARTRRLIERGAIVESLINGADALTNEQFKSFMEKILITDQARRVVAETKSRVEDKHERAHIESEVLDGNEPAPKITGAASGNGTANGESGDNDARGTN